MIREHSYGIIPLKKQEEDWFVLIVKHHSGGHWSFPKGHSESDEAPHETALRELKEETGLSVLRLLSYEMIDTHYKFTSNGRLVDKTVSYFLAEVFGDVVAQAEEIFEAKWVPLAKLAESLTYASDKDIYPAILKAID